MRLQAERVELEDNNAQILTSMLIFYFYVNAMISSSINMYSSSTFLNSSFSSLSAIHAANSNTTVCLSALPLGVAVIDAAIQLYGIMYPKVPNKHRLQMLLHFSDCMQKQATTKSNAACKFIFLI